jgi:hypothetical protein
VFHKHRFGILYYKRLPYVGSIGSRTVVRTFHIILHNNVTCSVPYQVNFEVPLN